MQRDGTLTPSYVSYGWATFWALMALSNSIRAAAEIIAKVDTAFISSLMVFAYASGAAWNVSRALKAREGNNVVT